MEEGRCGNAHRHASIVCGRNNGGAELAEEMNGERGRQGERIENTAVGKKKKKQKGAKGEGDNAGERIPGAYSARTLTHACACETRGMKGADVGIKFPGNATAVERRLS